MTLVATGNLKSMRQRGHAGKPKEWLLTATMPGVRKKNALGQEPAVLFQRRSALSLSLTLI
jgi:hypothetical protein